MKCRSSSLHTLQWELEERSTEMKIVIEPTEETQAVF